ncbi:activating transcription factor 3 isoform X3 [Cherax quadricarinatus]|uniref:activating transcription factor 3 isoform X3 n=1 Tax=Cherax quadricarinatus TaxID=27406 RepID=UPI00387EB886
MHSSYSSLGLLQFCGSLHNMYLNVNLTPPPAAAGEGSCTTPKTPEILNSLINLTSPPLPHYSQYQNQVEGGALLSPISDMSSPGEESTVTSLSSMCHGREDSITRRMSDPVAANGGFPGGGGGGGGLVGGSPGTSGMGGPLAGASPPSTPDLPSPVNTVEATKSALIKEGLKLQIRTKLQAAGVDTPESILEDTKYIKDENSDLTEEDEERRRRRRERNKIAATKCRNKKKEKTIVLMTESESVEDMNVRLKTEIQRLTTEKMNLEKLLEDPKHLAFCRHSPRCSKPLRPPLVIVTPADSPDTTSSSCSSSPTSSTSSSSLDSPTSPPLTSPNSYKAPPQTAPPATQVSSTMITPSATSCASSSSQFLAPKYSLSQNLNQRHHPYQCPGRSQQPSAAMGEKPLYGSPPSPTGTHNKPAYSSYSCMGVPRTLEFLPPNPPSQKSVYTTPKSRNSTLVRYNPYNGRSPPVPSPLVTHAHPQPGPLPCGDTYIQSNNNNGCGREDQQTYVTDTRTNQFFPPCSYSSM